MGLGQEIIIGEIFLHAQRELRKVLSTTCQEFQTRMCVQYQGSGNETKSRLLPGFVGFFVAFLSFLENISLA